MRYLPLTVSMQFAIPRPMQDKSKSRLLRLPHFSKFLFAILFVLVSIMASAQIDSAQEKIQQSFNNISDKTLRIIDNKYGLLQKLIEHSTEKALKRMQKNEADLEAEMNGKDSIKAKQLFLNSRTKYQQLISEMKSPTGGVNTSFFKEYIPGIDSIATSMKFFNQKMGLTSGLSTEKLQKVQAISIKLQQLQTTLQNANAAQNYISQREQQFKNQLTRFGMAGKVIGINKEAFYYQQQLGVYKNMVNDKEKLEEGFIARVQSLPAFQSFWQKHSYLSEIFPQNTVNGVVVQQSGLQKKSEISDIIAKQINSVAQNGSHSPMQSFQSQLENAKSKLKTLKQKAEDLQLSNMNSSMTMPDFTPNSQHTKSFLSRMEYGFNIQNTSITNYLPSISTLGLTLGYKLSDKMVVGIGFAYLLGLGNGIQHIKLSNQGVAIRSYFDFKAKGNFWITCGYEYNYMQQFASIQDIRNIDVWQKSALLGATKKYMIGKKQAKVQLLFNALYAKETPQSNPLVFRVGY